MLRTIAAQTETLLVPGGPEGAWDALTTLEHVPAGTTVLVDDLDAMLAALPGEYGAVAAESLEQALRGALPYATVLTHLEPAEDPRSFADVDLERVAVRQPS